MRRTDRALGMDRAITRRDFLNGVSVAVGGTMVMPLNLQATGGTDVAPAQQSRAYYPPTRAGMRGNHEGSYEAAHALRDGRSWDAAEDTRETYDLVVVGGGLSGLAAAYFFKQKAGPSARILILDNHDDFGGHAKRNEFVHNGRVHLATGGTSYLVRHATFTPHGIALLRDIGVDVNDPSNRVDANLYPSLGLQPAVFFDKQTFGEDRLVAGALRRPTAEFLAKAPLSEQVRADFLRLWEDKRDYLSGLSAEEKVRKLESTSYKNYLLHIANVHADVLPLVGGVWCLSTDCSSAWFAFYRGSPGFSGLGLTAPPNSPAVQQDSDHGRFPAGVSDVARLIVRSLIPKALPAGSMADIELKRVDYARLDEPQSPVRIRLNSTAVRVRHIGAAPAARLTPDMRETEVTYVSAGQAYRVRSQACVLACYHRMIPYLCPEMPEAQKESLRLSARAVNQVTNVLLRDWRAFERLGVSTVTCPGSFFKSVSLPSPRSFGAYKPATKPSESILITMGGLPFADEAMARGLRNGIPLPEGMPVRQQLDLLRVAMYQTPFEKFERHVREQLARVLAAGGFDPARDIEAIVVNRWPHGYALGANSLFDPDWSDEDAPWVVARKQFGRITIANTDASGIDLVQTAFDEAHRAVDELMPRPWGYFNRI
jgi:spermidine dehydrogenase